MVVLRDSNCHPLWVRTQLALLLMLTGLLCLPVSSAAQKLQSQELQTQPPPPPPASKPEKTPPGSAVIVYQNGELTIEAHNSTLGDILRAVCKQTGAIIDVPAGANERVVGQLGPGRPRDVVASLLNGSRFNYVMLGSAIDADALAQAILYPKPAGSSTDKGPPHGPTQTELQLATITRQTSLQPPAGTPAQETADDTRGDEERAQDHNDSGRAAAGYQASEGQTDNSQSDKTPQQKLQDLYAARYQMMQRQQQQLLQGQQPEEAAH
jgi:hypothetical protein